MTQKIVLLHGLFMHGCFLSPLRKRLQAAGFCCQTFSYPTLRRTPEENAAYLLPKIQTFANGETVYFVGHSLGGLVLRHLRHQAPALFHNSKVITLGTPHRGSLLAAKIRTVFGFFLKKPWQKGLDGQAPAWCKTIPLLSVAGTQSMGMGSLLRLFPEGAVNDGTVLRTETELPEAKEYKTIHASHTFMLYKQETADLITLWLKA